MAPVLFECDAAARSSNSEETGEIPFILQCPRVIVVDGTHCSRKENISGFSVLGNSMFEDYDQLPLLWMPACVSSNETYHPTDKQMSVTDVFHVRHSESFEWIITTDKLTIHISSVVFVCQWHMTYNQPFRTPLSSCRTRGCCYTRLRNRQTVGSRALVDYISAGKHGIINVLIFSILIRLKSNLDMELWYDSNDLLISPLTMHKQRIIGDRWRNGPSRSDLRWIDFSLHQQISLSKLTFP